MSEFTAKKLKEARVRAGLSQDEAASLMKLNKRAIEFDYINSSIPDGEDSLSCFGGGTCEEDPAEKVLNFMSFCCERIGSRANIPYCIYSTKIRQISMKEAETILDQMATCGAGTHLGKSDYIAVYNKDKLFKAEGEEYLVGSVLVFQRAGNVLKAIPDDEIGDLLEVAMAQMDTLKAGDACFSAMRVD